MSSFCLKCHRELTDAESISRLYGPECYEAVRADRNDPKNAAAVCLVEAAQRIEAFLKRVAVSLEPESMQSLRQRAGEVFADIQRYPEAVVKRTLWADASSVQKAVSMKVEKALEALADLAADAVVDGKADWRKDQATWKEFCGALDAATGYRLVAGRSHVRLAQAYAKKRASGGPGRRPRSSSHPLDLLSFLGNLVAGEPGTPVPAPNLGPLSLASALSPTQPSLLQATQAVIEAVVHSGPTLNTPQAKKVWI